MPDDLDSPFLPAHMYHAPTPAQAHTQAFAQTAFTLTALVSLGVTFTSVALAAGLMGTLGKILAVAVNAAALLWLYDRLWRANARAVQGVERDEYPQ